MHATGVVLMDYSTKLITSVLVDKFFGQYGYDYVTAGRKCVSLFTQRGWTMIINDDLISWVLMLMSAIVGGLTGCVGMLLAYLVPSWVEGFGDDPYVASFFIPFLVGTAMSHVVVSFAFVQTLNLAH